MSSCDKSLVIALVVLSAQLIFCNPILNGRIVGGTEANIFSFPYQLSLQYRNSHICGGTIIDKRYGLTAAHCVESKLVSFLSVYAGSNIYNREGMRIKVEAVIPHQNYDSNTSNFDIAIIKFSTDMPFSGKIVPASLPAQNEIFNPGTLAVVSGWGCVQEASNIVSQVLRKVYVPILKTPTCRLLYRAKNVVTNRMICAGLLPGGRDACQGDSGGPLVVNGTLVGIVSWGYGCARPGYPGVYTRVSKFIDWIGRLTK